MDFREVQISGLIERAIEANSALAKQYGVSVRRDAGAADAVVRTDSDRLAQVLLNLLSNAVKFSPRGEEVTVSVEELGPYVRIAVRDRGPGIPDEYKTLIFEKFAQVDATDTRRKGGTGLGLTIVRQTMARLGGRVGHAPAPSGGTVFYADVPSADVTLTSQRNLERLAT